MGRIPVARPEEIRDGRIGAVGDKIADPVATVQEASALPIDVPERALAGDDTFEAGCIGARFGHRRVSHVTRVVRANMPRSLAS